VKQPLRWIPDSLPLSGLSCNLFQIEGIILANLGNSAKADLRQTMVFGFANVFGKYGPLILRRFRHG
jgi:hypothetical protein